MYVDRFVLLKTNEFTFLILAEGEVTGHSHPFYFSLLPSI